MRLYIVGISSLERLADALRQRDLSVQVITDAHRTGEIACSAMRAGGVLCYLPQSYANKSDCAYTLNIWGNEGRFPLVQIGEILNWNGVHALFAVPRTCLWRLTGLYVYWRYLQRRIS
jgi:hypothetical protein